MIFVYFLLLREKKKYGLMRVRWQMGVRLVCVGNSVASKILQYVVYMNVVLYALPCRHFMKKY